MNSQSARSLAIAALGAASLASAAHGQPTTRTIESAQAFLSQVLGTGQDSVVVQTMRAGNVTAFLQGRTISVSGSGCVTVFHAQKDGRPFDATVDWTRIQAVDAVNFHANLYGQIPAAGRTYEQLLVLVGSAELMNRVKTAADFLRTQCDRSRGTGF